MNDFWCRIQTRDSPCSGQNWMNFFSGQTKQNLKLPGLNKNYRLPGYTNKNIAWDITKRWFGV